MPCGRRPATIKGRSALHASGRFPVNLARFGSADIASAIMVSTGPHLLPGIRACSAILLHSVVRAPAEPSLPAVADHPVALPAPVAAERGVPKAARAAPAVRAHASGYSLRCRQIGRAHV